VHASLPELISRVTTEEADRVELSTESLPLKRYEETARRLLILVALYAIPAIVVMHSVDDYDIWWHLRTGQWIVEHKALPTTDPFSTFGQGKPWAAYSWLFEVCIYGLYQKLGLSGILLYRIVMSYAVAVAIHRFVTKREPRFVVASVWSSLAFLSVAPLMTERPWLLTIILFTVTLDNVLELRSGRNTRTVWLLPLLYAIWANVQIQFVYGLFLLVLASAELPITRILGGLVPGADVDRPSTQTWWRLVALTVCCLLATLFNPYHVRLYGIVLDFAAQSRAYKLISELQAMDFRDVTSWTVLTLSFAASFALGRQRLSIFKGLLLISAAYLAFRSQRDIWFMVLTAVAILTDGGSARRLVTDRFTMTRSRVILVVAGVIMVLAVLGWERGLSPKHLEEAVGDKFPAKAAAFIEEHGYRGPLFNHFDWGGYLIWRLPTLPVSMDGRMNVHDGDRILHSCQTWNGMSGWDSDVELEAARLVLAQSHLPLVSSLRHDPRFELVYEDQLAVVFVARSARPPGSS